MKMRSNIHYSLSFYTQKVLTIPASCTVAVTVQVNPTVGILKRSVDTVVRLSSPR